MPRSPNGPNVSAGRKARGFRRRTSKKKRPGSLRAFFVSGRRRRGLDRLRRRGAPLSTAGQGVRRVGVGALAALTQMFGFFLCPDRQEGRGRGVELLR